MINNSTKAKRQNQFYLCIYSFIHSLGFPCVQTMPECLLFIRSSVRIEVINQNSCALRFSAASFVHWYEVTRRQIRNNFHSLYFFGYCLAYTHKRKHMKISSIARKLCCKRTISRGFFVNRLCHTATTKACYLLFVCVTQTERSMLFYPIRCNGRQTNGLYLNKIWKHLSMCTFRLTQWKSVFLALVYWSE